MKTANCPSCGAPVTFRSAASLYAVCDYCKSTLLRDGQDLANLGRMAELMDDPTRIQLGSEGNFAGHHFQVIGRIQLKYPEGLWNEWHILFDNGSVGWLSEAGGQYTVTHLASVTEAIPAFTELSPGQMLTLGGRPYAVSDLETAHCIAGEGELPFKVDSGYDVNAADLRNGENFASIDYSEEPPLVFTGQSAAVAALHLKNLREERAMSAGGKPTAKARALNCPNCGAPISLHSEIIQTVACPSCGSVIDTADTRAVVQAATAMAGQKPALPLGSKGVLKGIQWEVIGFLRRKTQFEGEVYFWSEYLLFHSAEGFAWLTEEAGHWNFLRAMDKPPMVGRGPMNFKWEGNEYRLFNRGRATVSYVLGEFYWQIRVGEECATADFVAAPFVLSRETTDRETSWSQGEYQEPDIIAAAFKPETRLPSRRGVVGNQPNGWTQPASRVMRLFWIVFLAATLMQGWLLYRSTSQVALRQTLVFQPGSEETVVSEPFRLDEQTGVLSVQHRTDLNNNWISLSTTLVNKDSGEAFQGIQDLSYYHGVDGGEHWSEGFSDRELLFRAVPPGNYYLAMDYELGPDTPNPVTDQLLVGKDTMIWSNYIFLMIFVAIFPLFARWRRDAFEASRWEEAGIGDDSRPDGDGGDDESSGGSNGMVPGALGAALGKWTN